MFPRNSRRAAIAATVAVCLLLPALPVRAAPAWDELPVDDTQKEQWPKVARMLTDGTFATDAERTVFDRYYVRYALARWSLVDNRTQLVTFRKELRTALRRSGRAESSQVHDRLNHVVLKVLNGMATGNLRGIGLTTQAHMNFHPAVRANAMLTVGQLNQVESHAGHKPVPLHAALRELVRVLTKSRQPQAVKVAAMVGIQRHAYLGAIGPGHVQDVIVNVLLDLLAAPRPVDKKADEDAWLRTQTATILGSLGNLGPGNTVVTALVKQVGDQTLPFSTRCAAAEALGNLPLEAGVAVPLASINTALRQLAIDSFEVQSTYDEPVKTIILLKERLLAVKKGLVTVATLKTSPAAASATKMIGVVDAMLAIIDDKHPDDKHPDETRMQRLQEQAAKL